MTKLSNTLLTMLAVILMAPSVSHAATDCLDGNNLVCITETVVDELSTPENPISRYTITNNSDTQIFAFAVTNASGNGLPAFIESGFGGWSAKTLSADSWDAGSYINFDNSSVTKKSWVTGIYLPSFGTLFGATTDANNDLLNANVYYNKGNENPLTSGVTFNSFLFNGLPESNFVAFDQNGSIITSSLSTSIPTTVAAVPEPSEYMMLLMGLGLLFVVKRKQQTPSMTVRQNKI